MSDFLALVQPLTNLDTRQLVGITCASIAGTSGLWAVFLSGWWWARR